MKNKFHISIPELIECLQKLDKRRYCKTPYIVSFTYSDDKLMLELCPHETGGTIKHLKITVDEV